MTNEPGIRDADAWFTPGRLLVAIGLVIFAAYPEVVLGSNSFFYRDFGLFTYPVAWYQRACFWRGEMPLWNPYTDCGLPFLAQWNTAVLYPFSLVYVLFPLPWSLNYFCLAHLLLAGLGMYFLAWHWTGNRLGASVAGLAFAWNGLSVHSLMWVSNLAALAWMPVVVLLVERAWQEGGRKLALAILAGGIQMLTGSPEIILLTWLVLGALAVLQGVQRIVPWAVLARRVALIVALVGGLAAAQILPFVELLAHSDRTGSASNNAWAMPAWGWANFLVPLFHCTPSILGVYSQDEQQWTSSYYIGIGVLALAVGAVWGRKDSRVWLLAGLAVAGVVLAMGEHEPVYRIIRSVFPWVGVMRYPIKLVVLTVFAVPLLAAYGVARLTKAVPGRESPMEWGHPLTPALSPNGGEGEERGFRILTVIGAVMLLLVVGILVIGYRFPHRDDSWTVTWHSGVSRVAFLALAMGAVFAWGRAASAKAQKLCGLTLLLVVGLDGLTHAAKQNPTVAVRAYQLSGMRDVVKARLGESRVMVSPQTQAFYDHAATANAMDYFVGLRRSLYLNCNLPEEIPAVHGFFSLYLKDEAAVYARLNVATNPVPEGLADFAGASQISSGRAMFEWDERTNFLSLVTAGQKPEFVSAEETLERLASPGFDPRRTVFLESEAREFLTATNFGAATVRLRSCSAQKLEADVEAAQPTLVVVSQSFYPAWRATVDGQPVRILRANHAFQALEVPAGKHAVVVEYKDRWFETGAVISGVSVLLCMGLWKKTLNLEP